MLASLVRTDAACDACRTGSLWSAVGPTRSLWPAPARTTCPLPPATYIGQGAPVDARRVRTRDRGGAESSPTTPKRTSTSALLA